MEREQRPISRSRDAKLILATTALTAAGVLAGTNVAPVIHEVFISTNYHDYSLRIQGKDNSYTCYTNSYPLAPYDNDIIVLTDAYCPSRVDGKTQFNQVIFSNESVAEVTPIK